MRTTLTLLASLLLFVATPATAQDRAACHQEIRAVVANMGKPGLPVGKQVYAMRYITQTTYNDSLAVLPTTVAAEVRMNQNQLHYECQQFTLYRDQAESFLILHPQRTVMWSSAGAAFDQQARQNRMTAIQDSIISLCKVKSCQTIQRQGITVRKVLLVPNKNVSAALDFSHVTMVFQPGADHFEEVAIYYLPENEIKTTVYTFADVSFDAHGKMKKNARSLVLTAKEELLPQYRNYQLVDNR